MINSNAVVQHMQHAPGSTGGQRKAARVAPGHVQKPVGDQYSTHAAWEMGALGLVAVFVVATVVLTIAATVSRVLGGKRNSKAVAGGY